VLPFGYDIDEQGNFVVVDDEAEIVREIIANIAEGATLYAEAQRLNNLSVPSPGHRYRGKPRKHGAGWIHTTLARIVHQSAYSGTHRVKTKQGEIERPVPPLVDPALQQRAIARLAENKRYSGGNRVHNYLLRSLIVCERCGVNYCGFPAKTGHYRYHKYGCTRWKKRYERRAMELDCPRVSGKWLEAIVWEDVKRFLSNPGEVLERVRSQFSDDDARAELEERLTSLRKKRAAAEEEKARLIRSYAKGTLDESELEIALPDVRNRIENLRLLIESVESDLAAREQDRLAAQNTEAWLHTLASNLDEVEGDSPEAFERRRELVRALVEKITVGRDENGHTRAEITYRFAPPSEAVVESRVADKQMFEEVPIPGF
jgi:site-specific DNA recombinase